MEIIGGILIGLTALVLLAALGLTTVVALAIMTLLGLLTNMSFKRLFFISFALGLLAPLMLVAGTYSAIEDGSLERDLRDELGGVLVLPDERSGDWRQALEGLQDLSRDMQDSEMTEEQIEKRLEDLFTGSGDVNIDVDGIEITNTEEGAVQIEID